MAKKVDLDVACSAFTKLGSSGQLHVPVEMRKALDIDEETELMMFADRGGRQLVVTVKPLDLDLFELATRTSARTSRS